MNVTWIKCGERPEWCSLTNLNLTNNHFDNLRGVYIVWSGKTVVRLGSGIIRDRLSEHRENPEITAYPDLLVTWSQVNADQMEGVEKYLADSLNPAVGERFPDRTPITVNFPW